MYFGKNAVISPIERQDEETRQIIQYFIAFFEGKLDLPELKARLAEYEERRN